MSVPEQTTGRSSVRPELWIYAAALVATALKLCIAFNTFGTNDVGSFYIFAQAVHDHGLEWTYANRGAFNHPPLAAYMLSGMYALDIPALQRYGVTFPFILRFPGIISDLVVVIALTRLRRELALPTWSLIAFALTPVSLMVSGFHGNTDPMMVMFLVLAAAMCVRNRPIACGVFLALSCQIKIVPVLLIPIFLCFWFTRKRIAQFLLALALTSLLFWVGPLLHFPALVVKNVLAYGSFWGTWGISYWLRYASRQLFGTVGAVSYHDLPLAEHLVSTTLKALIVVCVLLLAWRRRLLDGPGIFATLAYAWMMFFILSPGIAPQYMVWLAPFVLVLSTRTWIYVTIASSLFLFFFYNTIAHGFPWDRAISTLSAIDLWSPWTNWPWVALIAALLVLWNQARRADVSLRLFALTPVISRHHR
jgi:hypothetical protein